VATHRQGRRAVILIEGWDAAGKGGLIKRLTAELDPRFFEVVPIAAPSAVEKEQHWLQRFWKWLPEAGDWTIFDRSWYGRVAVERVEGFAAPEAWRRAYAEIEAFERMLVDDGIRLVKLFLHISQQEQDRRFIDRLETPWKRWKMVPEDFRNRARRQDYLVSYEEMFARTDFAFAPWHLVAADSKKAARIAGMAHVIARLEEGLDMTPPALDPALRRMAERALGVRLSPR
jgi:polyphosphate kinase 2 (PPK2 family)